MRLLHICFYCGIWISVLSACLSAKKRTELLNKGNTGTSSAGATTVPTTTATTPARLKTPEIAEVFNRRMSAKHRVLDEGDNLRVFLEIDIPRLAEREGIADIRRDFVLTYGLLPSYTSREYTEINTLKWEAANITQRNKKYIVDFLMPKKPIISAVMVMELLDKKLGQKIPNYDIVLNYTVTKLREQYALYDATGDKPRFSNLLLLGDTVQVSSPQRTPRRLMVRHYSQVFEAAAPPMSLINKPLPKNIDPDTTYAISTNEPLTFTLPGLYLIVEDNTSYFGLSFYVGTLKYPKLSRIKDLIDPLVYISTEEEMRVLKSADSTKREMDKYWLKLLSGNTRLAKATIREYYNRVRKANEYFTTYKEGWRTDQGMIHIIYGEPNRVIRTNDAEHWFYTQNANFQEIKFSFTRRPNQFSDEVYILQRFPDYEQVWYPVIEQWRSGKVQ